RLVPLAGVASVWFRGAAGRAHRRIFGAHAAHCLPRYARGPQRFGCSLTQFSNALAPLLGATSGVPATQSREGPLDRRISRRWASRRASALVGKRHAGDEDVHLADLETKHPLR